MSWIGQLELGVRSFLKAYGFVRQNRMTWLFLIPVAIWLLIAISFGVLGWELIPNLKSELDALLAVESVEARDGYLGLLDELRNLLLESAGWLVGILAGLLTIFLALFANKYLVLILLSPVMAYASERTEEVLTGNEYPFEWAQFFKDILRGILIALRNGLIELTLSILLWLSVLLMPILSPVSVVLLFLVSSYFYGFSTFDYAHERRRTGVSESVKRIRSQRWTVIGNGSLFNLVMKVPFLGMVVGPILASVGASIAFVENSSSNGTGPANQA